MATATRSRAGPAGGWAAPAHTARSLRPSSRPGTGTTASRLAATFAHREQAQHSRARPRPHRLAHRGGGAQPQRGCGQRGARAEARDERGPQRLPGPGSRLPLHQGRGRQLGRADRRPAAGPRMVRADHDDELVVATTRDRSPRGADGPSTKPRSTPCSATVPATASLLAATRVISAAWRPDRAYSSRRATSQAGSRCSATVRLAATRSWASRARRRLAMPLSSPPPGPAAGTPSPRAAPRPRSAGTHADRGPAEPRRPGPPSPAAGPTRPAG